jgi:hypothetical protein
MTAADSAAIYDQLVRINDRVAAVHAEVCEIRGACLPCQKRVDKLEAIVRGNGPGSGLEGDVTRLKQTHKIVGSLGTSIVALVSVVVGALFEWILSR